VSRVVPFLAALVGGALPVLAVVVLFFPGLLGYRWMGALVQTSETATLLAAAVLTVLRLTALLAVVLGVAWTLGRRWPERAPWSGLVSALPVALVGGALGVWSAMRPVHLLIVALVVAALVVAGVLGARMGARAGARRDASEA
jgi:hypothetical protein